MPAATTVSERAAAIRVDLGAIFVSMELSRSKWLITSLSPGGGEKMSKHMVAGGDLAGLLNLFAALQAKAQARTGHSYRTVVIQEAGLDGFWIHRALEKEGIESHVVDPASIATSRRKKRAKTDRIDGEALVRALLAYKRGEPRVCSMVRPPLARTLALRFRKLFIRWRSRARRADHPHQPPLGHFFLAIIGAPVTTGALKDQGKQLSLALRAGIDAAAW